MTATKPRVMTPYLPALPVQPVKPAVVAPAPPPAGQSARSLVLGTAAWALALGGLSLVPAEPGRTWAMLILTGAGVLAALAWWRLPRVPALAPAEGGTLVRLSRGRVLRLAGLAGAGGLLGLADTQFIAHPAEPFGLAGWLWLASMALLLAATVAWPRRAAAPDSAPRPAPWTWREGAALGGLLLLALALRLWDLQDVPFAIHRDEILSGVVARTSYLVNPTPAPIYSTVWDGIDLPALWFLGLSTAMKLGGEWLGMLRLPAALFGAALVLPFYGLLRGAWGRATALTGTAVLAVSAVDIHYSRVTINNIVTPFFWTLCFFFLLRGLRGRRPVDWVIAGLAAGLSEYGYYGTHLLPFVLLAFAGYLLVVHWRQGWRYLGHFALLALGYLAAFGPLLAYFVHFRPDIYFGRGAAQGVLMWNHLPRDWPDLQLMWATLWPLMAQNLLGFSTIPSLDLVYGAPLLLVPEAAILVLGLALLLRQWRHPAAFLLLLSGTTVLIVGGTLVHGVPYIAHWSPAFPAFYAAIALPLGAWAGNWAGIRPTLRRLGIGVLAAALLVDGAANIDFYFHRYYIEPVDVLEIRAAQSRWEAALGPDYRVFTVGRGGQLYEPWTNSFLVHGQEGQALDQPEQQLPVPPEPRKGLAFVSYFDTDQYRPLIKQLYPGGADGEILAHNGQHLFFTYRLTPQQVAALPPRSAAEVPALAAGLLPVRLTMTRAAVADPSWQQARGVDVLPDGALVVGDTGHDRVRVYGPDGALRASWGTTGTGDGRFRFISDVAVAPDGTIAVLDASTADIQLFKETGQFVARLPSDTTGVHIASGLVWAPDGSLYVADTSGGQVVHLARDGKRLGQLQGGSGGRADIAQPLDVAVLPDGSVYVADLSQRVVRFNQAGQMDAEWPAQVGSQQGGNHLAVWQGGIAMTDPDTGTLEFLTPGSAVRPLDTGDAAKIGLHVPVGIAAGPQGRLYVLSSGDNRVVQLEPPP